MESYKYERWNWKHTLLVVTVVVFCGALAVVSPGCGTIEGLAKDMSDMSRATRNAMTQE